MAYIGKKTGYPQKHFSNIESKFFPPSHYYKTGNLYRSPVTLSLLCKEVQSFINTRSPPKFRCPLLEQIIDEARTEFSLPEKVKPIHLNDLPTIEMGNEISSPGIPWKQYGMSTKKQVLHDAKSLKSVRFFWHRVKFNKKSCPADCSAFSRAHIVEREKQKIHLLWGYPATISFQEASFGFPLNKAYRATETPLAYGYEIYDNGCQKIYDRFRQHSYFFTCDFKQFDKTVPSWLIRTAFSILKDQINFEEYENYGTPVNLEMCFDYLVHYFINTPIRLCDGRRYRKRQGIASGSWFTQLIGSMVTFIVTIYAIALTGNEVLDILVLGDDSVVATAHPVDVEQFALHVKSRFGMEVNREKTQVLTDVREIKFLGYKINEGNPSRNVTNLWAMLRFPERKDHTRDEYATRAFILKLANFGHDAEFDAFCAKIIKEKFVFKADRELLRFLKNLGYNFEANPIISKFLFKLLRS